MKKFRSFLEYLAASLIILMLLSLIGSVVTVKFYGDDLQSYAMEIINNQLDTKISIDEVGISVLKKFPNTVVIFNNVTVWSGHRFIREDFPGVSTDTLFIAEEIYVQFNALDLLKKKYSIKALEARNGELRIFIDSSGISNFMLEGKNTNNDAPRPIEIKGVELKNLALVYTNHAKALEGRATIKDMFFEGNFAKQNYLLKVGGNAFIEDIFKHKISYLSNQELKTDVALQVENNRYIINKGEIILGDLTAGISGEFLIDKEVGADLDLHFVGKRIGIEWISELLASKYNYPPGLRGSGKINLSIDLSGLITPTIRPHVEALFSVQNASLGIKNPPTEIRSIAINGAYSSGYENSIETSIIKLKSFSARVENSFVQGTLQVENLFNPIFNLRLYGNIFAKDISHYFSNLPFTIQEGNLIPELNIIGKFSGMSGPSKKVSFTPSGKIELKELSFQAGPSNIPIRSLNGILDITSGNIGAKIKGSLAETDLEVDLSLNNPFINMDKSKAVQIEGSLYSTNIDLDQLQLLINQDSDGENSFLYPKNIGVNLNFQFDKVKKGEIITEKVKGRILYKYPGLYIDPFYLETMNGSINSRIALSDLDQPIHQLIINSTFKDVNVQNLFLSFNNFGQDFLTHQNIAGNISGTSEFLTPITNDFEIKTAKIVSSNSLTIKNGELNNFQPMIELSNFLKIDKMDHIQFSNISNTFLINKNQITIPEMDIKSSAISLQASGRHSFDKTFEYHLATKLSDILFNKAKSAKNMEFDIALDKGDQRTIFLVLYDKGNGIVVDFDHDPARKKIRNDLKEEKNELKVVLNEEFGFYKNDTLVKNRQKKTDALPLKFEFTDDDPSITIKIDSAQKTKWWERKKSPDKKPTFDFVIDDSDI